jgi:hypothetical protein
MTEQGESAVFVVSRGRQVVECTSRIIKEGYINFNMVVDLKGLDDLPFIQFTDENCSMCDFQETI